MLINDIGNALFEIIGAFFTWNNAWVLYKDKQIKGVYWPATAFFAAWGLWNLYYYHSLEQYLSWYAGMVLVIGNVAWVVMAIKYLFFGDKHDDETIGSI